MKHKPLVVMLGLSVWLAAAPAFAQVSRVGETFSVWSASSRGSAVGFDTKNNVYLVVSAHGSVNGRFVSADGAVLGDVVVFQAVAGFGQFPQLAYSPDTNGGNGGFLVTWHESDGAAPSVHRRMISYTSGFLTPDLKIVGNDTYHEIMGAPVAYSTVSHEFLVVWRQFYDVNIFGLRMNANGDPISGVIGVAATTQFESDQSITYNPATNEFFVVYRMGFNPTSVMGQRIQAGTGVFVGGPSILSQASTVDTTGVAYNPTTGQYLAAWHQMPGDFIAGRVVAADGTPIGNAIALSTRVGTYDSLSVDANEISGTVLLIGHDKLTVEVGGVEIDGAGNPLAGGGPVTNAGGTGNFVPKVSSNPTRREWLITAARSFTQTIAQRVSTATPGGGVPPPPPPNKRATIPDLDGDSVSDLVVWRPGSGTWYSLTSSSGYSYAASGATQWGSQSAGDVPLMGDMDGDGKADLIVWRASTGTWYWLTSSSGYNYAAAGAKQWGNHSLGDVPIVGDIDGDGKVDLIVWRASTGTWFWLTSSSGYNYAAQGQKQWGSQSAGDVPKIGDIDGDGKSDLIVWRAPSGTWLWLTSSSGYNYAAQGVKQWGAQGLGDVPLVGDVDGDGKTDLVVWRAPTGTWFWLTSSSGYNYAAQGVKPWGSPGGSDVPVLTDFDGDGRAELTVWRPSDGTWYWLTSKTGYAYANARAQQWGSAPLGDIPVLR